MEREYPDNPIELHISPEESEQGGLTPIERMLAMAPALGEISIKSRTVLGVRLTSEHIRIAQKKMGFSYSREQRDYADYRYRFFKALAEHQSALPDEPHESFTTGEVWALMGEEGELERDIMIAIRRWLPTVSYYRQPLIVTTGKRGRGSRYSVNPNFLLELQEPQVAETVLKPMPEPSEIYENVRHLGQFDFVMRQHGVIEMDPELEMVLETYKPDYRQMKAEDKSVQEFRAGALAKLDELLTDPDYMSRYKESVAKGSPEYGLLRYLFDLSPNERFLVKKLLKSTVEPVSVEGGIRLEAIDEFGMLIAYISPRSAAREAEEAEQLTLEDEPEAAEEVIYDRQSAQNIPEREVKLRDERMDPILEVVEAVADEIAGTFLVSLRASKSYRLAQVQAVFPRLTTNKLVSAKSNNIINPTREQPLSLEDVVRVMIHSDVYLRNIFTTRKYKDRIDEIIQRVITENIERVEKELTGE